MPLVKKVTVTDRVSKWGEPLVECALDCNHNVVMIYDVGAEPGDTVACEICAIYRKAGVNAKASEDSN